MFKSVKIYSPDLIFDLVIAIPSSKKSFLYFDVVLLSYSGGNSGGGFSYSREEVFPTHLGTEIIEGRWILPMFEGDPGNTMYEFIDGWMDCLCSGRLFFEKNKEGILHMLLKHKNH